jgi:hypothetical protein
MRTNGRRVVMPLSSSSETWKCIKSFASVLLCWVCFIQNIKVRGTISDDVYHVGLLIKVSTADEELVVDDNKFIAAVYSNKTYSVTSHLRQCSSSRAPLLVPYQGNVSGVTGIMKVNLLDSSASYNRTTIVQAAIDDVVHQLKIDSNLGLRNILDFVIFCVPNGISGPSFLASGAYNSFWIIAKPAVCTNANVLLHEFGHVYGLKHARQGSEEYGDETSIMGITSDAQYRCFNGYNFWKLGWFNHDYATEVTAPVTNGLSIKVDLATFVDVSKLISERTVEHPVVLVKIYDLYLVYNRRKGFNNETGEYPNMVTVVRALDTEESNLLAGLNETNGNNIYRYVNNNSEHVTIQICERIKGNATSADRFVVAIGIDNLPCAKSFASDELDSLSRNPTVVPAGANTASFVKSPSPSPSPSLRSNHQDPVLQLSTTTELPTVFRITLMPAASSTNSSVKRTLVPTHQPTPAQHRNPSLIPTATIIPTKRIQPAMYHDSAVAPTTTFRDEVSRTDYTQSPFPKIDRKDDIRSTSHRNNTILTCYKISIPILVFVVIAIIFICFRCKARRKFRVDNSAQNIAAFNKSSNTQENV